MEIKNLNINNKMISAYKSVGSANPKGKGKLSEAGKTGGDNFDKIEFNFGKAAETAKADITSALAAEANIARIEQLQASYEGNHVPVTAQQIAETIVG
jgi:hypothetical protein